MASKIENKHSILEGLKRLKIIAEAVFFWGFYKIFGDEVGTYVAEEDKKTEKKSK